MIDTSDQTSAQRTALDALVRHEIVAAGGRLAFDRFMDLVLYAPGLGYYVAGAPKLGPKGDFVTAPEISPLFARCLAAPSREVLTTLGAHGAGCGDLLELGAGTGALAAELLTALAAHGPLPERYLILEPSPDLAERQRRTLTERVPELCERCHWLERLPEHFNGIILANEVLDAMPVHRFQISDEGRVQEVCVGIEGEGFAEILAEPAAPALQSAVEALQARGLATQPGYRSEINLRLAPWTQALATMLNAGLLLLIDYGYPRAEFYLDERDQGTLMCHSRHRAHSDPYRNLGLQDITAHVDFSALAEAGQASGLELAGYTTQANFLIGCGIDALIAEAGADDPLAMLALTAGAKQLLLPSQMGERFQVLALSKGLDALRLGGFAVRDLSDRL
ncbi:class I SAM-dependent methyltransferase [Halochromatium salexigens]|uniref:SAM-dependent methyltransferase n=1 Tax=Halochromatium salexigens TaxID=49447 RepID=A0AAJ0UGC8_HALSE|nr:SAM-dependent methyltransferase [Halochromatium salexigens]MBK5930948.1 SAM-dependent methyltransferase [Halochromatium salexigens]